MPQDPVLREGALGVSNFLINMNQGIPLVQHLLLHLKGIDYSDTSGIRPKHLTKFER